MTSPRPDRNGRGSLLWIGLLVVVVVLGVVAVVAARGGDDDGGDEAATASADQRPGGECPASTSDEPGPLPAFDAEASTDEAICRTPPVVSGDAIVAEGGGDGEGSLEIDPGDGRPKVVMLVAHWCPHCQREVPVITEHLDGELPDDVDLVAVSTDERPEAGNHPPSEWLAREGWPVPTLADDDAGTAAAAYGLTSFPYFVALDADGRVVARASGELPTEQFDALVEAARTGVPPA